MFDAVLFDMDGLLLDSERVLMHAWTAAAALEGRVIRDEVYASVIGRAAKESTRSSWRCSADLRPMNGCARRSRHSCIATPTRSCFPLKQGVVELLAALRSRGVPCAVASSSRAEEIRHRLEAVGVLEHFDAVAGGNEVTQGKPDPAVYRLAAERLGVPATACVAFEDSENGARAALAAGAALVVVPDLRPPPQDILTRSLHVFESLDDAHDHLPRWFPG